MWQRRGGRAQPPAPLRPATYARVSVPASGWPRARQRPGGLAEHERALVDGLEGLVQRRDQGALRVAAVAVAHQRLDLRRSVSTLRPSSRRSKNSVAATIISVVLQATTVPAASTSMTTPTRLYIA